MVTCDTVEYRRIWTDRCGGGPLGNGRQGDQTARTVQGETAPLHHFIVIAPNESPMSLTAGSWLIALGEALQRSGQTAPMSNIHVSKNDHRTWVVEDRDTGRRYLIINTDG